MASKHVGQPGHVVVQGPRPLSRTGSTARAAGHSAANGVDVNADAMVDFMHAKSMIGSIHAATYRK